MDSFSLRYAFWVAVAIVAGVTTTTAVTGVEKDDAEAGACGYWSVGEINGEPRNEYASLAENEFRRKTAVGEVVTIRSATDIPQVIRAGQSFVIHLGAIPAENLVLRLAMTARCTKHKEYFANPRDHALRILFNDQPIWHRWYIDTHAKIETYIPPNFVDKGDNMLVIENLGKRSAAIDAIALDRYQPGDEVLMALEGAHGQAGKIAMDVRQAVLRLDAPRGVPAAPEDSATAPRDLRAAIRTINALKKEGKPQLKDKEAAKTVARWEAELAAALRRGLLPVVEVRHGDANESAWRSYARRYGGIVHAWLVGSDREARWLRDAVEGARVYKSNFSTASREDKANETELFDGAFLSSHPRPLGGRLDRSAAKYRLEAWDADRAPLPLGLSLRTPSAQTVRLQRRNGEYSAETMLQFGMAGGDALLVDGGMPGGKLFPSVDGATSPAWESIRPLFALGAGRPRRAACAVVPAEGNDPLIDTHWMAVENNRRLASVALLPSRREEGRNVRVMLPVPWQGPTEGVVEGVKYGNWRKEDPHVQQPEPLKMKAFFSPHVERSNKRGKRGHVSMEIELDGLKVIRLWPRGAEPYNRERVVGRRGIAAFVGPGSLRNVFHKLKLPPSSGFRYELLREPDWPCGRMGGEHSSEVGPATLGDLPARKVSDSLAGDNMVFAPNTVPWRENSLFITFRSDEKSSYAYQLFQNGSHTWKGAWGMMVYARVVLPDTPKQRLGLLPPAPVGIWMGTSKKRGRIEMSPGEWRLIAAPYSKLISQGVSSHDFYVWTDDSESRKVVLELNGFMAVYNEDAEGRAYCGSSAAIRFSESGDRMLMLVEGDPGAPAVQLLRLEDPAHIKKAVVSHPKGYSGIKLRHRRAAQIIELRLPPLPAKEDGLSVADTKDLFPAFRPRADKSRVVIGFILQR